jgi:hypothetical protein
LRHYATTWKVAGLIPDEVMESPIDLILPATLWQAPTANKTNVDTVVSLYIIFKN